MQADLPHTLYRHRKSTGGGSKGPKKAFKFNPKDPAIARQEEANRRAAERRAARMAGKAPVTMNEVFK
ncbi:MAG: hypothetical protein IK114_14285 [Fibrobacter sp.]|nr:hypothetical protein [Fibrobacter sp.]